MGGRVERKYAGFRPRAGAPVRWRKQSRRASSCRVGEPTRSLEVTASLWHSVLPQRVFGDGLGKRNTRHQRLDHEFQCQFGRTQGAHAVVNSTGTEPTLRDLKAATLPQQEVFRRHTDIVEQHFAMAMRRIVITEHGQHAQYSHARAVERNENLRLLSLCSRTRLGLAHHDCNLASRIAYPRRPPFTAVADVAID